MPNMCLHPQEISELGITSAAVSLLLRIFLNKLNCSPSWPSPPHLRGCVNLWGEALAWKPTSALQPAPHYCGFPVQPYLPTLAGCPRCRKENQANFAKLEYSSNVTALESLSIKQFEQYYACRQGLLLYVATSFNHTAFLFCCMSNKEQLVLLTCLFIDNKSSFLSGEVAEL